MDTKELIEILWHCSKTGGIMYGCMTCPAMGSCSEAHKQIYDLVLSQQKRIEELTEELKDERYRHDRLQDFEVAEAQELARVKAERDRLAELLEVNHG